MSQDLGNLITSLLGNTQDDWKVDLVKNWKTAVGGLSRYLTLESIRGNTLTLGVSSSSWMQEMFMLSGAILETINKHVGKPVVKQVRFKQRRIRNLAKKHSCRGKKSENNCVQMKMQETTAIRKIKNPELAEALTTLLSKCRNPEPDDPPIQK